MKAIVLAVEPDEEAESVARLIAAALLLNGYRGNTPAVIDWPPEPVQLLAGKDPSDA